MQDKRNHKKKRNPSFGSYTKKLYPQGNRSKSSEIKNALKSQGIKVVTLIEIHSENVSQ